MGTLPCSKELLASLTHCGIDIDVSTDMSYNDVACAIGFDIAAIREIIYIHHEFLYNSSQPRIVSGHDDLDIALLLEEGGMDGWWTGAGWFVEKKIACLVASQS